MKKITTLLSTLLISAVGFQTQAQITSYPYLEDFESGAGGWTVAGTGSFALGAPAAPIINSAASGSNAWVTNLTGFYAANEDVQVESPIFDLSATVNPEIRVNIWWESEFSWDGAALQSSIDGGTSWQNVGAFGDPNNWYTDNGINGNPGGQPEGWTGRNGTGSTGGSNGWVSANHDISSLSTQSSVTFRMAFGSDGSGQDEGFGFDDFSIVEITCPQPSAMGASTILDISANLDWTEIGSATAWEVQWGTAGFTLGAGTVVPTTTNPYSLTGLTAQTAYDFYVRSVCGAADTSFWSGPFMFTTACATMTAPFLNDVEAHTPATGPLGMFDCWSAAATTNYDWNITGGGTPSSATGATVANSGVNFFYTEASGAAVGAVAELYSPNIDISTLLIPSIEFSYHMFGNSSGEMGDLFIDVNNGSGWTTLDSIIGQQQTVQADPWLLKVVDISAYTGVIQVRFRAVSNGSFHGDISLDDIEVKESTVITCAASHTLTAANITTTTVDLAWTSTATNWELEYGMTGFMPGAGTAVITATNPHVLTGLTANTAYDFYVRSICGAADTSSWSLIGSFSTLACDAPTTLTATNITTTSADLGWTGVGAATLWDIELGAAGFTSTGTPTTAGTTNTSPATGLTSNTSYDFYVRSDCGGGDLSLWAGPFNFTTNAVGIDENAAKNSVSIFPNPNNGVFTLSVNAQNATVKVMNTQGQVILSKNILNNKEQIDLSENAKGIYFVTVTSNEGTTTQKVIVQ